MLKVVHAADVSNENGATGGSLLDEIVRDGARAMLAAALAAEVAAYIDAHVGEVDENGYRLVVRNGYHGEREVLTSAGAVPVRAPRVKRQAHRRRGRATASVLLGDPAGVGAQVSTSGPGAAAVVPAWPVQQRLRPGARAVPRVRRGPVGGHDHTAHRPVARRRRGVHQALIERHRLRVCVGRRDPSQGSLGAGQGVSAGDDREPRGGER